MGKHPGLVLFFIVAAAFMKPHPFFSRHIIHHPVLMWTGDAPLEKASDVLSQKWIRDLERKASQILPTEVGCLDAGCQMNLDLSRQTLSRVSTLAGLFRLDGDPAKADRA